MEGQLPEEGSSWLCGLRQEESSILFPERKGGRQGTPCSWSCKVSLDVAVLLFSILKYWLHLRGNACDSPSGTIASLNARFCQDPQLHRPRHRNIFGFSTSCLFYSEQNCTPVCFYANVIFLCVLHISLLTCNHN